MNMNFCWYNIPIFSTTRGPSPSIHGIVYPQDYLHVCNGYPCLPLNSCYLQFATLKAVCFYLYKKTNQLASRDVWFSYQNYCTVKQVMECNIMLIDVSHSLMQDAFIFV